MTLLVDCACSVTVYADGSGVEMHYCDTHEAAPKMLAALDVIEDACGFAQGDIDAGDHRLAYDKVTEARHAARAAIALARGEAVPS